MECVHPEGASAGEALFQAWDEALLFRTLPRCGWMCRCLKRSRTFDGRDRAENFEEWCQRMKAPGLLARVRSAGAKRAQLL